MAVNHLVILPDSIGLQLGGALNIIIKELLPIVQATKLSIMRAALHSIQH